MVFNHDFQDDENVIQDGINIKNLGLEKVVKDSMEKDLNYLIKEMVIIFNVKVIITSDEVITYKVILNDSISIEKMDVKEPLEDKMKINEVIEVNNNNSEENLKHLIPMVFIQED